MEAKFELGDFELDSGAVLRKAYLGYETHGELNDDKSNVIVYPTWFGGVHEDNRGFIGEGQALDPSKYFIIVPDQFCNAHSSSPSNHEAPQDRMRFPLITPYDNVNAQHKLLTEHFGIEKIAMVVGYSMSAQQCFHWAAAYPDMVERIAPICGTSKTTPHDWIHLEGMKAALQADAVWAGGDYRSRPEAGMRAAAVVVAGWAMSQTFYRRGLHLSLFGQDFKSAKEFIDFFPVAFESWDANDFIGLIQTWQSADVSNHSKFGGDLAAALGAIKCPALLMPCETDLYFPPEDSEIEAAMMPNAELRVIPSIWGHIAAHPLFAPPEDVAFIDQALKDLLARA
ncbi:MAG: alpha/beta fold hydrolase [Pseudomonadales bacterium]